MNWRESSRSKRKFSSNIFLRSALPRRRRTRARLISITLNSCASISASWPKPRLPRRLRKPQRPSRLPFALPRALPLPPRRLPERPYRLRRRQPLEQDRLRRRLPLGQRLCPPPPRLWQRKALRRVQPLPRQILLAQLFKQGRPVLPRPRRRRDRQLQAHPFVHQLRLRRQRKLVRLRDPL